MRSVLPVSAAGVAAALHPAAPLRLAALARGGACCDAAVVELVARWVEWSHVSLFLWLVVLC